MGLGVNGLGRERGYSGESELISAFTRDYHRVEQIKSLLVASNFFCRRKGVMPSTPHLCEGFHQHGLGNIGAKSFCMN